MHARRTRAVLLRRQVIFGGVCFVCAALLLFGLLMSTAASSRIVDDVVASTGGTMTLPEPSVPPVDAATHARLMALHLFHKKNLARHHESGKYSHYENDEETVARMEREYALMMRRSKKQVSLDA